MTLYLCKIDKQKLTEAGKPSLVVCLGAIGKRVDGYYFFPWSARRKPTRVGRRVPEDAIPAWAKASAFGETVLLNEEEFQSAKGG